MYYLSKLLKYFHWVAPYCMITFIIKLLYLKKKKKKLEITVCLCCILEMEEAWYTEAFSHHDVTLKSFLTPGRASSSTSSSLAPS